MDYELFDQMSLEDAHALLSGFVESEKQALEEMKPIAALDGIDFDYSLSSLADVLKWMIRRVRVHWVPVPVEEPVWIRQAHPDGLIEFDEDSKAIILRAGYYLGECFARLTGMRWTTGDVRYMHKNMPVVAGFRDDDELPPLVVIENVFARILGRGAPPTDLDSTIEVWKGRCAPSPS